MLRGFGGIAGLLAAAAFPAAAAAADIDTSPIQQTQPMYVSQPPPGWTITLGAEARMLPAFDGSSRSVVRPVPLFDFRRAGTPRHFSGPRDGFGFGLFDTGSFRFGPSAKLRLPRRESDDVKLTGLGNVDYAIELGAFVELWPVQWLRTRGEIRQGLGGHHGIVADWMADVVLPVTTQLTFSAGPRVTYVTAEANRPYFSITVLQSLNSGLPVFDAKGGIYSYGGGAQVRYEWNRQWATHVFVEYERLTGDAANSPLVVQRGSPNQVTAGLGITYSFDVPGFW